jgi:hypothetical protein
VGLPGTQCLSIGDPSQDKARIGEGLTYSLVSPAGLTTQVGFIRLAHERNPNSGEPEFGGPSTSKNIFAKKMDCRVKPGNDGAETVSTILHPFDQELL